MQNDEGPLQKHTLNLWEGDYEKLRTFFPDVGAGAVIRRLVRRAIEQIEATGNASGELKVDIGL